MIETLEVFEKTHEISIVLRLRNRLLLIFCGCFLLMGILQSGVALFVLEKNGRIWPDSAVLIIIPLALFVLALSLLSPWILVISGGELAIKHFPRLYMSRYMLEYIENLRSEQFPRYKRGGHPSSRHYCRYFLFEYNNKTVFFGNNVSEETARIVIEKINNAQALVMK